MLPITLFGFGFALWLGLYLLARDARQPLLRNAGLGLGAYALALAGATLFELSSTSLQIATSRALLALLVLPPIFWSLAMISLLPEDDDVRLRLEPMGGGFATLAAPLFYLLALLIRAFPQSGNGGHAVGYILLAALLALIMLLALFLALRAYGRATGVKQTHGLLVVATLFFALGLGLLVLPLDWFPFDLLMLVVAPDLLLLGVAIAFVDAFSDGEALWPDLQRSLASATVVAVLFGLQVGLVMWLATGITFAMVTLLFLTVGTAILLATFSAPLSAWLDRVVLSEYPERLRERRRLQTEREAALRRDDSKDPLALPQEEFARLTRRAFSYMNNLPRLARSPLTRLPQVERRLRADKRADTSLERAGILREVLVESVERLKPHSAESFANGDEWRFYNALYFPYVVGLRPYSRRANHDNLAESEREALQWLRRDVPQRTLYNWQTTAAELVARDLRERSADSG